MFKKKTLFVVGAGASEEARLPTGHKLKSIISDKLSITYEHGNTQITGDREIVKALRQYVKQENGQPGDINPYLDAGWRISEAMPQAISIDNFIEAHEGDEKIELSGKLAIVRAILEAEHNSLLSVEQRHAVPQLNHKNLGGTWYNSFAQLLTEGVHRKNVGDIFKNISFITFNYDRCVEHFLFHSLQTYYGLVGEDAAELVRTLSIYHPYGVVGALEWQGGQHTVPFGRRSASVDLLSLSGQIKTFSERIEDEAVTAAMRQLVRDAEVIVFLGFAFHPQNMELIRPTERSEAKRVIATAMGISDSDTAVVIHDILELLESTPSHTAIELRNGLHCHELFGEYWRSF